MVKKGTKYTSVLLSVLMLVSVFAVMFVNVSTQAGAASGDVIYFEKPGSWGTPRCYVWSEGSAGPVAWPGTEMTAVQGEENVYAYTMPGNEDKVIFNNGNESHQTVDLKFEGGNKIFKVSGTDTGKAVNGAWSAYAGGGEVPTQPTQPTSPTQPTTPTNPPVTGEGAYAYLKNDASWTNPTVYYWKDANTSNSGWPGAALKDSDKDALGNYVVFIPESYLGGGVIFSNGGQSQSPDLVIKAGEHKIYNNKDGSWEIYDTSKVQFKDVSTDLASPQYRETDITVSASAAGGSGDIQYKFSVKNGTKTAVLSDYSAQSSVVWTPDEPGTYSIVIDVKDSEGNTNSRTISPYVIEDDRTSVKPVLNGVTPADGSELEVNKPATINVKAAGGVTGTNLLFYKVAVKAPNGSAVNTVYYKTGNTLAFTPVQKGTYTVTVSVQNSANTTVERTFTYESVGKLTPVEDPIVKSFTANVTSPVPAGTAVTLSAQGAQGVQPYEYRFSVNGTVVRDYAPTNSYGWVPQSKGSYTLKVTLRDAQGKTAEKTMSFTVTEKPDTILRGDVDLNGKVELSDVLMIQKYLAKMITLSEDQLKAGDVTDDGKVDVSDVLKIQNYLAKKIAEL